MDDNIYTNETKVSSGLPYDNINWYDVEGQPFGSASGFNVIVFNDANNIVDIEGPVAIGGNYYSPRGLSVGFARDSRFKEIGYSPDLVRFLVGGNVSMTKPLVVIGHVVAGGGFRAGNGSTYLIGKDGTTDGIPQLKVLYQANGGSQYWTPTDKGDHYIVPSYDVPRYIPASRVNANISKFFSDARESIGYYKNCIEALTPNGTVVDNYHELILRGNDPVQNVFLVDVSPNGLINKGLRAEVPQGSTVIVRLKTGPNAHLQYGVYGESSKANRTLYVFEDATNIYMEKSSDFWGSILAPQAMFHAHPTGGHVSGNAALGSFAVNANSGFEFHFYPFVGGIKCQAVSPAPEVPVPVPEQPAPTCPEETPCPTPIPCPECPTPKPCPAPVVCPAPIVCPEQVSCPKPEPCKECPTPEPCPVCPTCPAPIVCPTPIPCPECPKPEPCPTCPVCPECPKPEPCPACPVCPECPKPEPCPVCPTCPECPACPECPVCEECLIKCGVISGCIWGCCCGKSHQWDVKLYQRCDDMDTLLFWVPIDCEGKFEFLVPYEGYYILKIRMAENCCKSYWCKPMVSLTNIGVSDFMVE
jgi:choice-of-anchor A domain-containing protein